jgi:hypothetical protein
MIAQYSKRPSGILSIAKEQWIENGQIVPAKGVTRSILVSYLDLVFQSELVHSALKAVGSQANSTAGFDPAACIHAETEKRPSGGECH